MKLLFLTQVLDLQHGVLGFVVRWVEEFAKHVESVRVVALEVGDTTGLPDNVEWLEIGREGRILRYFKYKSALNQALGRDGYDAVLAHMVPRYALVAAGPAKRHGARLYLWYTHKGVDARLIKAVPLTLKTFSASEESLRVSGPNRVITGHGIDTDHFDLVAPEERPRLIEHYKRILSVGRLTPAKDPLCVLRCIRHLLDQGLEVALDWVGGGLTKSDEGFSGEVRREIASLDLADHVTLHGEVPYAADILLESDRPFAEALAARAATHAGRVTLLGAVPHVRVAQTMRRARLLVNTSHTGSVDKVVLEAMAARRPALSCNDSFPVIFDALPESTGRSQAFFFPAGDAQALAAKLTALVERGPEELAEIGEHLRELVVREHGVEALCERLIRHMEPGS